MLTIFRPAPAPPTWARVKSLPLLVPVHSKTDQEVGVSGANVSTPLESTLSVCPQMAGVIRVTLPEPALMKPPAPTLKPPLATKPALPAHMSTSPPEVVTLPLKSNALTLPAAGPVAAPLPTVRPFHVLVPPRVRVPPAQKWPPLVETAPERLTPPSELSPLPDQSTTFNLPDVLEMSCATTTRRLAWRTKLASPPAVLAMALLTVMSPTLGVPLEVTTVTLVPVLSAPEMLAAAAAFTSKSCGSISHPPPSPAGAPASTVSALMWMCAPEVSTCPPLPPLGPPLTLIRPDRSVTAFAFKMSVHSTTLPP